MLNYPFNIKSFILELNPILEGYLNRGLFNSIRKQWCKKFACRLKTKVNTNFSIFDAVWYDGNGVKID